MPDQNDQDNQQNQNTPGYDPDHPRQDHLEQLKQCIAKGPAGIKEWNQSRKDNIEIIYLQGADLNEANLQGANLVYANLQEAKLYMAKLQGAELNEANLRKALLIRANLQRTNFGETNLQEAILDRANLQGANLFDAKLQGAQFENAIVDGQTLISECKVNKWNKDQMFTDFSNVGLDSCRIDPATKQLLQYNIRRNNWHNWYLTPWGNSWYSKALRFPLEITAKFFTSAFWMVSDYGRSTIRILFTFALLALIFALVYSLFTHFDPHGIGIVKNLVLDQYPSSFPHYIALLFTRSFYFSIVTMTTLGFGDISASPLSSPGQILLMVQVLLGYILLGALITRFAILFTATAANQPRKSRTITAPNSSAR